jgi:hypothetical protein
MQVGRGRNQAVKRGQERIWRAEASRPESGFHSRADQNQRQTGDERRSRCGNGNLGSLFFVNRGLKRADFCDLLLLMVGVRRMQNGGDTQKYEHNADNHKCALHATNLSTTNLTQSRASPFSRCLQTHPNAIGARGIV